MTTFIDNIMIGAAPVVLMASSTAVMTGCDARAGAEGVDDRSAAASSTSDAMIDPFRLELLDLAFEAASVIPADPHLSDQAKAQCWVIDAWFTLDQPRAAMERFNDIGNWRRGVAYGDLAFYCAQLGHVDQAREYAATAEQIAAHEQEWRRDRILVNAARTHAWLGQHSLADRNERGVENAETGKVDSVRAQIIDEDQFDALLASAQSLIESGDFDLARNAQQICLELMDRFYEAAERRAAAEESIRDSWAFVPVMIRIDSLVALGEVAMRNDDGDAAAGYAAELRDVVESYNWTPEYEIEVRAKLAMLLHGLGDSAAARTEIDLTTERYRSQRDLILRIDRAGALRRIAEVLQAMGDSTGALETYAQAVETGADNPNQRPRALDLVATATSMAVHGVEPDASLRTRMIEIREGLDLP